MDVTRVNSVRRSCYIICVHTVKVIKQQQFHTVTAYLDSHIMPDDGEIEAFDRIDSPVLGDYFNLIPSGDGIPGTF